MNKESLQNVILLWFIRELVSSWLGFPDGSVVKKNILPANAKDTGSTPGSGLSSGVGNGNPLQCSCLEKMHGQRSLAGYSPWGREESNMTEHACTHSTC